MDSQSYLWTGRLHYSASWPRDWLFQIVCDFGYNRYTFSEHAHKPADLESCLKACIWSWRKKSARNDCDTQDKSHMGGTTLDLARPQWKIQYFRIPNMVLPIDQLMDGDCSVRDLSLVLRKMREIRIRYTVSLCVAIWWLLFLVKETFLLVWSYPYYIFYLRNHNNSNWSSLCPAPRPHTHL